jgi:hypothetical protein
MLIPGARLLSYVVARDYGFAPNPFFGRCTLATCKPDLRRTARIGEWIVGIGSTRYKLAGKLVYAMQVGEALPFEQYWTDPRFALKRPNLRSGLQHAFGDNIYRRNAANKRWIQADSHHSLPNGKPHLKNIENDTSTNRVLVASWFVYLGRAAVPIPARVRKHLCGQRRGHGVLSDPQLVADAVEWIHGLEISGYAGEPFEFRRELTGRPATRRRKQTTR